MQTFYIHKEDVTDDLLTIKGDVCHHISRVLRMHIGDALRCSDQESFYYEGTISEITREALTVAITKTYAIDDEPGIFVTLIQCLPRGDKFDTVSQKTTELGISRIIPVESENSQVRLKKDKKAEKQQRWQRIAASAAEQCGRGCVPEVLLPVKLPEAFSLLEPDTEILFCYEADFQHSFGKTVKMIREKTNRIALVIGPEGGFSSSEAENIIALKGHPVTMGKRILRTETAGPTALSALMFACGEWEVLNEN